LKKTVLAAAVVGVLLEGCSPFALNIRNYTYKEEALNKVWREVSSYRYIYDFGEYWESPMEFETRGGGDCEDFAIDLVYRLGDTASSVCIQNSDGGFHEIVKFNSRDLEPQRYGMYYEKKNLKILWEMSYADTIGVATLWGIKSLKKTPPKEHDSCSSAFSG
jgi:hypothetical protein